MPFCSGFDGHSHYKSKVESPPSSITSLAIAQWKVQSHHRVRVEYQTSQLSRKVVTARFAWHCCTWPGLLYRHTPRVFSSQASPQRPFLPLLLTGPYVGLFPYSKDQMEATFTTPFLTVLSQVSTFNECFSDLSVCEKALHSNGKHRSSLPPIT